MTDLLKNLQRLGDAEHDDLSVAYDALDEIVRLRLLITAPPQREWQSLTDEEIEEGQKQSWVNQQAWQAAVWWAEDKLREKNS